jgi:hypothetical protein
VVKSVGDPNQTWIEHLRCEISVFDARDNLVEVLGRLADLDAARAAFKAACQKYPDKELCIRDRARVVARRGDVE